MTALIVSFLFAASPMQKNFLADTIPVQGYSLFWSDEFDNVTQSKLKWDYRALGKRDDAWNTKDAVRMNGGFLYIDVFRRNDSIFTGMISTEKIFETRYGYFECRVKMTRTRGTFPSFWLQSRTIDRPNSTPETNGAELDIFEYYPHTTLEYVSHAMHWGGYGPNHRVEGPVWGKLENTPDNFHIIGFEWTETSYSTFVDGKKTFTGNQLISKVPEFLILSVGVSTTAAGPLDITSLPDHFVVDYVRIYKKN